MKENSARLAYLMCGVLLLALLFAYPLFASHGLCLNEYENASMHMSVNEFVHDFGVCVDS